MVCTHPFLSKYSFHHSLRIEIPHLDRPIPPTRQTSGVAHVQGTRHTTRLHLTPSSSHTVLHIPHQHQKPRHYHSPTRRPSTPIHTAPVHIVSTRMRQVSFIGLEFPIPSNPRLAGTALNGPRRSTTCHTLPHHHTIPSIPFTRRCSKRNSMDCHLDGPCIIRFSWC